MDKRKVQDFLDRALYGRTPEEKARVLDLVQRLGISPEDEFWLILIAIGHLQFLVEDAPVELEGVLARFTGGMEQWTKTHLATLQALAAKAETAETLAETANRLAVTLEEMLAGWETVQTQLPASHQEMQDYQAQVRRWQRELSQEMDMLRRAVEQLRAAVQVPTGQHTPKATAKPKGIGVAMALAFLLGGLVLGQWWQGRALLRETQALLEKQTRLACQEGRIPAEDTMCLPYR